MFSFIDRIPLTFFIAVCASLGMAPFFPEPHVWEKLQMLFDGTLTRQIDMFDLLMHGTPWILLGFKLVIMATKKDDQATDK